MTAAAEAHDTITRTCEFADEKDMEELGALNLTY